MSIFEALWLGIVQALTEFLPVSSSGHLVVLQNLFGMREPMVAFDVLLHIGSLAAILVFYRQRIWDLAVSTVIPSRVPGGRRLIGLIILASIPAAAIGLSLEQFFESMFSSPQAVGIFWLLTAGLLFGVSRLSEGSRTVDHLTVNDALLIGLFQAVAILPGVSRSGATIVMGILCGLRAKDAADFSFLIAIPAILGATLLKAGELANATGAEWRIFLPGAITAAVLSYAAIWFLLKLLRRRVIRPFAWYCLAAGSLTLLIAVLR
ncbi:undecaprenyl-diphosphate phosphatase [candidate division KSB1 bacterium]|nr:MAG: undecaprenyl-diphosphate phosphatase [candidate division KSB1 bacterium]